MKDEYGIERVASYARVSTEGQRYKRGLMRQYEAANAFCLSAGYEHVSHHRDVKSGALGPGYDKQQRRGLAEAIDYVDDGNADAIVVESFSRLVRGEDAWWQICFEIGGCGIPLIILQPSVLILLPPKENDDGAIPLLGGKLCCWRGAEQDDALVAVFGELPFS